MMPPAIALADDHGDHSSMGRAVSDDMGVSSPASELRSTLTHLFTEHAFLAFDDLDQRLLPIEKESDTLGSVGLFCVVF